MKLVRTVVIALAVLVPTSWTIAKAADPAAPAEGDKKEKKGKKEEAPKGDKK
jgi:hypothetical protein